VYSKYIQGSCAAGLIVLLLLISVHLLLSIYAGELHVYCLKSFSSKGNSADHFGKVSIYVFTMVFGVIASCILFEEFKILSTYALLSVTILGIGLSSSIFLKECWAYEVGIWRWVPVSILILDSALLTCISNLCAIVL